jgi:hypothetical protein
MFFGGTPKTAGETPAIPKTNLSQRDKTLPLQLTHSRRRFTSVDVARANVNPYPEVKVCVDEIPRHRAAKL